MKIQFPDGNIKEFESGATGRNIADSISEHLGRVALAVKVNGEVRDLDQPLQDDCSVQLLTHKEEEGMEVLLHSAAHVMALAVKRLFPGVKLAIGPAIENGFYYDFDNIKLTNDDFNKIEEEMKKVVNEKIPFVKQVISRQEALEFFKEEPYKLELIQDLPEDAVISYYSLGELTDLCKGPHVPNSGYVKAFKLLRLAGAYWRGDSSRNMLVRLYGTAFTDKKLLKEYLELRRIAEESDHVRLGRELDLFITDKTIGQGLPLFTPRGATIKRVLQRFIEDEEIRRGYVYTFTPFMGKSELYQISGHWEHYKENMFIISDESCDETLALRPMTCPYQFTLYNRKLHSYKELPVRFAETSTLFRNESSGSMHGLIRVRQFTLSEGHIICTPDQLEKEFHDVLDLISMVMKTLDLTDYSYRFSKWDPANTEKYINNPQAWEESQTILKKILDNSGIPYVEADGEAAFYGPKLDIQMKNVWGKEDTIITVQIDFALPGRFNMKYQDKDGVEKTPFIIHRSSIGCYERTIALLIERYKGKFPFWLTPEQIRILTVNDTLYDFAEEVKAKLMAAGLRSSVDRRDETLNKKIRDAQLAYIPAILTLGNKEKDAGTVSVRTLDGTVTFGLSIDDFINQCGALDRSRSLTTQFSK